MYEVTLGDELYVLTGGDWFRIQLDFKRRVYEYVDALDRLSGPPAADPGTDEDAYNRKAASAPSALTRSSCAMTDRTAWRYATS